MGESPEFIIPGELVLPLDRGLELILSKAPMRGGGSCVPQEHLRSLSDL